MAGADDRRKKQSVEDFLFARLSLGDDEDSEDESDLPDLAEDDTTHPPDQQDEAVDAVEPVAPPDDVASSWGEVETQPFPVEDDTPFPSDDEAWSAQVALPEEPGPPLPEPPPWERDSEPTPAEWELPAAVSDEDSIDFGPSGTPVAPELVTRQFRPDGDTSPLPEAHEFPPTELDDEPSEGPELSDPGPWALGGETTQEPEIEDLEEPSLSRGPSKGGGFDEVFPAWGLKLPADRARRGADEETNALLLTDGGLPTESRGSPARGTPVGRDAREHEPVGSDPNEPATQWHQQLPAPHRRMAEEKTDIRGFQAFQPEIDPDDAPTVIVPPPPNLRASRDPTPRPPLQAQTPRPSVPPATDDPRTTAVIAWTASALGVLMFVLVLVAGTAVAWPYLGF